MNTRDAVNEILLSLNELPLDTEDAIEDVPTAVIVNQELDVARKKILMYGWHFNTITLTLAPNTLGHIAIPKSFLSVKGSSTSDLILRDWKLFDKTNLTYVFEDAQEVVAIQDIPFDDIPFSISTYIVQMASLRAYINIVGNTDDISVRNRLVEFARIEAIRDDANNISGNLLSNTTISEAFER